jgi:hypothetical protein
MRLLALAAALATVGLVLSGCLAASAAGAAVGVAGTAAGVGVKAAGATVHGAGKAAGALIP